MNPTQPPLPPMPPLPQMNMPNGNDPFGFSTQQNNTQNMPASQNNQPNQGGQNNQNNRSNQNRQSNQGQQQGNNQQPAGGNTKQQAIERLKTANNVLVTVSKNPSLDQLSASIGLTLMMSKLGKHATTVFSGEVPSLLEFLEPNKTIEKNTDSLRDFIISLDKAKADKLRYKVEDKVVKIFITPYRTSISQADLEFSQGDFNVDVVVALGVHNETELDEALAAHGRILHDATVITIMNSSDVSSIGAINWSEPNASSLSEMLVSMSEAFKSGLLDSQMATAFLTGIVAETERFSNEKTSPKVMTMSAQLMAAGANQQLIATKLEPPAPEPAPEPAPAPVPEPAAPAPAPLAEQVPDMPLPPLVPTPAVESVPQPPEQAAALSAPEAVPMATVNRPKPVQNTNVAGLISIDHSPEGSDEAGNVEDALDYSMHDDSGALVPDIHIDAQGNLKQIEEEQATPVEVPPVIAPPSVPAPETTAPAQPQEAPQPPDAPMAHEGMKVIKPFSTREQLQEHKGIAEFMTEPPSRGGVLTASGEESDNDSTSDPLSLPTPNAPMLSHDAPPADMSNDEKRAILPPMPGLMDTPTPAPSPQAPTEPATSPAPSQPEENHFSLEMPEPPLIAPNNTPSPPPGPPPMMPGFNSANPFGVPDAAASNVPPPSL